MLFKMHMRKAIERNTYQYRQIGKVGIYHVNSYSFLENISTAIDH